jgi:ACS family 4-hydroxyphenylacetate permease-like MFS transporter
MLGLVCCNIGVYSGLVILWAFTPHLISPAARPAGMAFIATCGNASSIIQMTLVGFLLDLTHSWAAGLIYVMTMLLVSALLVLLIPANENVPALSPATKGSS